MVIVGNDTSRKDRLSLPIYSLIITNTVNADDQKSDDGSHLPYGTMTVNSNLDEHSSDDEPRQKFRHVDRREYLKAIGALGVSGLVGTGSVMADATGDGTNAGFTGALTRYDLTNHGLGNAQTDTPPFMPRLKTHEGRQYYAYWTHAGQLVATARDLPDGEWARNRTGIEIDARNGHWTPSVGIGPDGHIFLNYNTRDSTIRWRRSTYPEDISSFGAEREGMTGQNESSVTYLEFTRLLDGTLLVGYRDGQSGAGNWMLNRWNTRAEAWEPVHHPLIDGAWNGNEYNSYMWNLVQSDDGMLHYFFCWRETGNVQTNGDLSYARSIDGGETWEKSDGSRYDLPITYGSAEIVDPIPENSNLINQGWASYDPRNNAPHVAYYRDDQNDVTQVFHAFLDDGEWITEAATDRTTNVRLGGPGVVASPIGRMGIVVGDDGDVHILTRDFENGSWPLLVEKLDGEWQTSVLYKRNMAWSDVHIDPHRWRADRVLSFVDHQQNVGDVPWSTHSLLGTTDVDVDTLDRTHRSISLSSEKPDELTTYVSTGLANGPVITDSTSFEDTSAALVITETTVPATPVYARATVAVEAADGLAAVRVKIDGKHGTTHGESTEVTGEHQTGTTEWTKVTQAFRAGVITAQVASPNESSVQVSAVNLQLGYHDPTPYENTVAPTRGASE